MWHSPLILALRKERQANLCDLVEDQPGPRNEFRASWGYLVRPRLKTNTNKQTKKAKKRKWVDKEVNFHSQATTLPHHPEQVSTGSPCSVLVMRLSPNPKWPSSTEPESHLNHVKTWLCPTPCPAGRYRQGNKLGL